MTNDDLFIYVDRHPYADVYSIKDFGFIEQFKFSGRIIATMCIPYEWHMFPTLQEAKDWLLSEAMKIRMTK